MPGPGAKRGAPSSREQQRHTGSWPEPQGSEISLGLHDADQVSSVSGQLVSAHPETPWQMMAFQELRQRPGFFWDKVRFLTTQHA